MVDSGYVDCNWFLSKVYITCEKNNIKNIFLSFKNLQTDSIQTFPKMKNFNNFPKIVVFPED